MVGIVLLGSGEPTTEKCILLGDKNIKDGEVKGECSY